MTEEFETQVMRHLCATIRRHAEGLRLSETTPPQARRILADDFLFAARALLELTDPASIEDGIRAVVIRCRTCEGMLRSNRALDSDITPKFVLTLGTAANAIDYLLAQPRVDVSRN